MTRLDLGSLHRNMDTFHPNYPSPFFHHTLLVAYFTLVSLVPVPVPEGTET